MDKKLIKNRVRLVAQGTLSRLPRFVRVELDRVARLTGFDAPAMFLNLSLSYGGRQEIVDSVKQIGEKLLRGECLVSEIDEPFFRRHLYQPHIPDPDLLIRTGGDYRVSNFLLWQIAYCEIFVTKCLWPDFDISALHSALEEYSKRQRRFGLTGEQASHALEAVDSTHLEQPL